MFVSVVPELGLAHASINSPAANVSPEWQAAYVKAQAIVANLSLSEKVSLGTGELQYRHRPLWIRVTEDLLYSGVGYFKGRSDM